MMSFPPPKARMEPLPWQQGYLRGARAKGDLKTERQYVAGQKRAVLRVLCSLYCRLLRRPEGPLVSHKAVNPNSGMETYSTPQIIGFQTERQRWQVKICRYTHQHGPTLPPILKMPPPMESLNPKIALVYGLSNLHPTQQL